MQFRETVAVYCENHTEHTDTLCGQNAVYIDSVCTSQETRYVSATKLEVHVITSQTSVIVSSFRAFPLLLIALGLREASCRSVVPGAIRSSPLRTENN
jgi:hypothetical protein